MSKMKNDGHIVDRILDFNQEKHNVVELKAFEKEIIKLKNAKYIFLFAKYIKGADIKKLSEAILKTNEKRYIHFFIRSIENIDYEKFINKLVKFNDSRLLYYVVYDTEKLDEKYIIKIAEKIYDMQDDVNLYKLLYYYFEVLHLSSKKMYKYIVLLSEKTGISLINHSARELFEIINRKEMSKYVTNYKGFTKNCYKGRNGFVPDIIVCHITSKYEKAISMFYDESSEVSSHYVISKDGRVKQVVDLLDSAWANGVSLNPESDHYYRFSINDSVKNRKTNANYYTFSIEHESITGELTEIQYKKSLEVMINIIKFIKKEYDYNFIIDRKHIIGHNEISPVEKNICPGRNFPIDRLICDLKKHFGKEE